MFRTQQFDYIGCDYTIKKLVELSARFDHEGETTYIRNFGAAVMFEERESSCVI